MRMRSKIGEAFWAISLMLIGVLVILWQLPGTIAARNTGLGLLLVCLLISTDWSSIRPQRLTLASWMLIALTSWILAVIFLWSPVRQTALSEFRGQWLVPLGCWVCGVLAARVSMSNEARHTDTVVNVVFWALFLQIILHNLLDIWFWIETGGIPFRQAPVFYLPEIARSLWQGNGIAPSFTGELPDKFSYVNNTFAALLIAEVVQRALRCRRFLNVSNGWLVVGVVSILLCSYFLRMRNGNVGLIMLIAMTGVLLYVRLVRSWSSAKKFLFPLAFLVALSGFAYTAYKSDQRWASLVETVPVALDTESNRSWLDVNVARPTVTSGEIVELSAYERIAWIKEGVLTIAQFPMGLGYNRNAFGVGIKERYGIEPRSLHSHSGVIDFTLANGIPGIVLWVGFLLIVASSGWRASNNGNIALGFMTLFVVTGFLTRSMVDSNIRDHILQQFMFFAGLFYILSQHTVEARKP